MKFETFVKIFHETFQEGRFGTWKHALKNYSYKYDDLQETVRPYPTKHANMQGVFCDPSQEGNDLQMGGLAKALKASRLAKKMARFCE